MKKLLLKKSTAPQLQERNEASLNGKKYSIAYSDELNAEQLAAVFHGNGPALVLAGAGTGKTRILVYRLARMVEDGIHPSTILLLTFTRKSSTNMLRRAALMLDGRCEQVSGGTFHSFAHQMLRKYAREIGFESNFTVLDQSDMEDALNIIRSRSGFDKEKKRFPQKHTLASIYGLAVNKCIPFEEVLAESFPQFLDQSQKIGEVFQSYIAYKKKQNMMDYDDLLVYTLTLLEQYPKVQKEIHAKYHHIMIDEYQDTNTLQHRIVKALAAKNNNIMAVGDDAQSIYSFRGANVNNILEYPLSFPGCKVYPIEHNYRSVQSILDLSNRVLESAVQGYKKELYSSLTTDEKPMIISAGSEQEQSAFVVQQILALREEGVSLNDMAVLIRSGFMSFDLEIELTKANIPFRKFGGFKFIETAHIKDILSFFRIVNNPLDVLAWHRILLLLEGVGPSTANSVVDGITAGTLDYRIEQSWQSITRGKDEISRLCNLLRKIAQDTVPLSEKVFLCSEFYRPILRKKYDDYAKRWKDIETFMSITERYEDIPTMMSEMALDPPTESAKAEAEFHEHEYFTISTIHSAKGLEWNTVFILWALDGRFPPNKSLISIEQTEEERRLMYVAITRAKEHLYIVYPVHVFDRETGMVLGTPSRFLDGIEDSVADRYMLTSGDDTEE